MQNNDSYLKKLNIRLNNYYGRKIIKAINNLPKCNLTLLDIGAAGDIEPRWRRISPALSYIGFEPDARSYDLLINNKNECFRYRIIKDAVWSKNDLIKINLCKKPMVSSFYEPNDIFLKNFKDLERFKIDGVCEIKAKMLDSVEMDAPDFVKLDIQGGELEVLRGANKILSGCIGLEIEVEFLEMYKGQPLFGEVKEFLSHKGFEFIDFVSLCRWGRESFDGYGQNIFGDALFLRSPESIFSEMNTEISLSKYLAICLIYNRFDLIDRALVLNKGCSQSHQYESFQKISNSIRIRFNLARSIQNKLNSFLRLLGCEFKGFLMY